MGWETRDRGGRYYYRKFRVGSRVVSRYIGAGNYALLAARFDAVETAEENARRAQEREGREADEALDELLDALGSALRTAAACELVAAGCHNHRGQWRVIRGKGERQGRA